MRLLKLEFECIKCDIWCLRNNIVTGVGNPNAMIMIVGEAPGYYEDKYAEPFIGEAGIKLKDHYEKALFTRNDFWITNTIKCRPPANRTPSPMEIANCRGHLKDEINHIKPWIIVPMGAIATNLFYPKARLTSLRGKIFKIKDTYIVPMFHPSYAIRNKKADTVSYKDWERIKVLQDKLFEQRTLNL